MIYLASLFSNRASSDSDPDKKIRHQRYEYTLKRLTEFWKEGNIVFSPIVHCYDASNKYDLPKDYTFWQRIDRHMIDNSDEVWVLKMNDGVG